MVHRSQHEELDLVSVEEFYKQAPSHFVKSVSQSVGGRGRGGGAGGTAGESEPMYIFSSSYVYGSGNVFCRRMVGRRMNTRRCCSGWSGS